MAEFHKIKSTAIKVGDLAIHRSEKLDARKVVKIDGHMVWLEIDASTMMGPFPRRNYVFQRRAK